MSGMKETWYLSNLRLDAIVTQPVIARDIKQAEEKAKAPATGESAEMESIALVNELGEQLDCRVKDAVRLSWIGVRRTEHSLRYEAVYSLRVSILAGYSGIGPPEAADGRSYTLRVPPVAAFPVLRVRTPGSTLLLKVDSYVLQPVSIIYRLEGRPLARDTLKRTPDVYRFGELNDVSK